MTVVVLCCSSGRDVGDGVDKVESLSHGSSSSGSNVGSDIDDWFLYATWPTTPVDNATTTKTKDVLLMAT
jgi:hypothetical protein